MGILNSSAAKREMIDWAARMVVLSLFDPLASRHDRDRGLEGPY